MEGCKGYSTVTLDGTEYDCEYEFSGEVSCDDCMFGNYGGTQDPRKNPYEEDENILKFIEAIDYYHEKQIDLNNDFYGSIIYDNKTNKELYREYKEYGLLDKVVLDNTEYIVISIEKDIRKAYTKVKVELFEDFKQNNINKELSFKAEKLLKKRIIISE